MRLDNLREQREVRILVKMEYPIMAKRKSQHDILRKIFAEEGTVLPLGEIAKKLGTTPVSARAAMATLRNPKKEKVPFVITRVPKTQDYCHGTPAAPKVKKKVAAKRSVAKRKGTPKGSSANGPRMSA